MSQRLGDGGGGALPDWYAPPPMAGGHVAGPVLIAQSDRLVVVVRSVLAYPTGVEVEVEAHARGFTPTQPPAAALGQPDGQLPDFRLRLADGTEVAQDDEAGLHGGHGPTLMLNGAEASSGGPGGREDVRVRLWIWRPPPGPLTLVCSWPRCGLTAAALDLDPAAIAEAAARAVPFWPADS